LTHPLRKFIALEAVAGKRQSRHHDEERRQQSGVPAGVTFLTKPQIALEQIAKAYEDGVPPGVVLMDAGYGVNTALRDGVTALGLSYVAGIQPQTSVWKEGKGPTDGAFSGAFPVKTEIKLTVIRADSSTLEGFRAAA
jgi:SRSO17 transposase